MFTTVVIISKAVFLYLVLSSLSRIMVEKAVYLLYLLVFSIDYYLLKWLRSLQLVKLKQGINHQMMRMHIQLDQLGDKLLRICFQWENRKPYFIRVNILNLVLALFSYHMISSHYAIPEAIRESIAVFVGIYKAIIREYNNLSVSIKSFLILVLCAPLFYHAFQYCSVRIFKMERYMTPHIQLLSRLKIEIERNITSLKIGKRELLRQKTKEITAGIGYDLREGGLVAEERLINLYYDNTRIPSLSKIQGILHELETITLPPNTNQAYLLRLDQDIQNLIQKKTSERIFCLSYYEQFVFAGVEDNDYFKACTEYFTKNKNQIYKHKFTKARVVRTEALERLDYYEGMAFEKIMKYKADIDNYYFCLLENQCRLDSFVIRLHRKLYTTFITEHIGFIVKNALREYWRILSRLVT